MKVITVKIPENKYKFFLELVKSLGFVKIENEIEGDSKEEIIENLRAGFSELSEIRKGKKTTIPAETFLNEL